MSTPFQALTDPSSLFQGVLFCCCVLSGSSAVGGTRRWLRARFDFYVVFRPLKRPKIQRKRLFPPVACTVIPIVSWMSRWVSTPKSWGGQALGRPCTRPCTTPKQSKTMVRLCF